MTAPNCDWFWGSHGCDMPGGHEGTIHTCGTRDEEGPDSRYDTAAPPDKRVQFAYEDSPDGTVHWGEWGPYAEGFGMGKGWGGPSITPPHTHFDPNVVCSACTDLLGTSMKGTSIMPAHGSGEEPIGDRRGKQLTPEEQAAFEKAQAVIKPLRDDPPPAEPTKTD